MLRQRLSKHGFSILNPKARVRWNMEDKPSNLSPFIFRIETIGDESSGLVFGDIQKISYVNRGIEFDKGDSHYFIPYSSILYVRKDKVK